MVLFEHKQAREKEINSLIGHVLGMDDNSHKGGSHLNVRVLFV